ncbi:hypothetical protein G3I34_22990 [Streptomyces sp. SID8014]|uniref:hypothetical protein n=1 Tax=Streptomyces sp. SID8014 TaxID=2706097 RepID=UPI0013BCF611|nr:hypothetical protein [Streptomyces sp. SID8014]NEC15081.1 hypothetical protein [Streptomyces sp. SID8014]
MRRLLTRAAVQALTRSTTVAALVAGALVALVAADLLLRAGMPEPLAAVLAVLLAVGPMGAVDQLWSRSPSQACNRLADRLIR